MKCPMFRVPRSEFSADALEARYRSTHDVHDLMAWSDAVGAESVRLCAEVDRFREQSCLTQPGRTA